MGVQKYSIATAPRKNSSVWTQRDPMTWDDLVAWLGLANPADHKECGGYVLGVLESGQRTKHTVLSRSVVALDADSALPSFVLDSATELACRLAFYTTWSHTPERPHYRLLVPLSRDVSPAEYRLIAEALMVELDREQFDPGSVQPERLMFRPSTQGGDYQHWTSPGDPLDTDEWLARAKELGLDQPHSEPLAAYDGPGYDDLTDAQRAAATTYLQSQIDLWRDRFAEAADWPEGVQDEDGRGWEALSKEAAWALARLAATPWVGWDEDTARDCYSEILPDEFAADEMCGDKWYDGIVAKAAARAGFEAPPWESDFEDENEDDGPPSDDTKRVPLAVRLRQNVEEHYDVFPAGDDARIFVQAKTGGRAEQLGSGFVMRAAAGIGLTSSTLSAAATEAAKVLSAWAEASPPRDLAMRVHHEEGRIVLDLAQPGNTRCVVIRPDGWTVSDVPPAGVIFMSSGQPLPDPERGGSVDELRSLLRWEPDDPRWPLVMGWLPAALLAKVPRPLLGFFGPQGSAKTTTGRFVVGVLDPKPAGVLGGGFGKNGSDDETKAMRSYLPAWDNVSALSGEAADRLSRLVTGDMIEKRKLYTDADMISIQFRRTGVVTGVTVPRGIKPDTLDRFILVHVEPLSGARVSESVLDAEWEQTHPRVLAGVMDLAVTMLARLPEASGHNVAGLRMADYAEALWAIDRALYDAYAENVGSARADMADDDPFIRTIVAHLKRSIGHGLNDIRKGGTSGVDQWQWDEVDLTVELREDGESSIEAEGTAEDLRTYLGYSAEREQWWPRNGKVFADEVTRTIELLRAAGVTVSERKSNGRRLKKLRLVVPA